MIGEDFDTGNCHVTPLLKANSATILFSFWGDGTLENSILAYDTEESEEVKRVTTSFSMKKWISI